MNLPFRDVDIDYIDIAISGDREHDSSINELSGFTSRLCTAKEWPLETDRFSNLRSKCISISQAIEHLHFLCFPSSSSSSIKLYYNAGLSNGEIILQMFLYHCHRIYHRKILRKRESYESSKDALNSSNIIPLYPFPLIIQHAID